MGYSISDKLRDGSKLHNYGCTTKCTATENALPNTARHKKIHLNAYSCMPLQTRNITKGVPPRLHLQKDTATKPKNKSKAKPKTSTGKKSSTTKRTQSRKSRKRDASESGDESEESSPSDESEHDGRRKKKRARHQEAESEEEVEQVDADVEAPVEDVDDVNNAQPGSASEDEVSVKRYMI